MSSEQCFRHCLQVCKNSTHPRSLLATNNFQASDSEPSSSPRKYSPDDDVIPASSSPPSSVASDSSAPESQKLLARQADPHGGQCLITNSTNQAAIQICHLVDRSTDHSILTRLEYAWGLPYGQLNIDSCYNLIFLRANWHVLFKHTKPHCMLIPMLNVLQKLEEITNTSTNDQVRAAVDLEEVGTVVFALLSILMPLQNFRNENFLYHLLPTKRITLGDIICRVEGAGYTTHRPPFATLSPLVSHVHPQYAVVNAVVLAEISGEPLETTLKRIYLISKLYDEWTGGGGSPSSGSERSSISCSSEPHGL